MILAAIMLLVLSTTLMAQDDQYGMIDTIYAEPYQIDAKNWAVNVSMFNDEEILALSVPLVFNAGKTAIVADSTIFKGGVAEAFRVKHARVDTSTQCVTIGLIADVGISVPPIPPGKGRVATIFLSALDKSEFKLLSVDTTTTPPGNNLQLVKPPTEGIVPAFVVKKADKVEKEKMEEKAKVEKKEG
ncbi:MAG: hypothetical protein CVT49_08460 [candidate division Zixibacteria bacterium HGW-Zixibacteria-1]|nr:MAG: hypothetical protein CVT49_08460 [candidate division Zixibacteria bacterium HGW-Zixibacteria-1]